MGDPKYSRRVWRKPKRPLNYNLMSDELKILGNFGLRTKRELWKARTELSRLRQQARSLLALGEEIRQEQDPILLNSLARIGLVKSDAGLDDILKLQIHDVLARRLQSVVMKNMDFKTPYQARQAVIHGHIMIRDRIVDIPSYIVTVDEEKDVHLVPGSTLAAVLAENKRQAEEEAAKPTVSDGDDDVAASDTDPGAAHGLQKTDMVHHSEDESKDKPSENIEIKDDVSKEPDAQSTSEPKPPSAQGTSESKPPSAQNEN